MPAPAGRLGVLVLARLVDQGALGLGSVLLARELGPDAFAPVAVLLVVNSLAIQVSDLGLGFAVLRSAATDPVARASLVRVRRIAAAAAVAAGAVALALLAASAETAAVVVATSGAVWLLSAEGRVRKASALTLGRAREAASAEIAGAVAFALGVVVVVVAGGGLGAVAVALVAKHLVELAVVRGWAERFTADGDPARSGAEWLGQVMTYLVANADYVVLGLLLSPADLSRYAIAFRVASAIPALVATPITQTAFLDLAAAGPEARQGVHDGIRRRVLRMGLLGAAAVLVAAPVLPPVLGEGWSEAAPLVAILAVAVPFRLLLGMSVAQAIVVGRARSVVGWEAGRLVAVAGVTAVAAAAGGLVWATVAVSAATVVSVSAAYVRSARVAAVRPWGPVWAAAGAACLVVIAFGVAWG